MPDEGFDPEDFEGITPKRVTLDRATERRLTKAARERDELAAKLAQLERTNAFLTAGIPNEGAAAYFIKGYDGPTDDPAVLRQAAIDAGFLPAGAQQQQERVNASLAGHGAAVAAGTGALPPGDDSGLLDRIKSVKTDKGWTDERARLVEAGMSQLGVSSQEALDAWRNSF